MKRQSYPFRKPVKSYLLNRRYLNFCAHANMRSYWLACSELKERCKRKSVGIFKLIWHGQLQFFILFLYSLRQTQADKLLRIWMVRYSVSECWMFVSVSSVKHLHTARSDFRKKHRSQEILCRIFFSSNMHYQTLLYRKKHVWKEYC